MDDFKHFIWVMGLIVIIGIICGTIIYLNNHPYNFEIKMDNNTLEAIKSVNWSSLNKCPINISGVSNG